jgi:HAD superfamily hydrolase (TIGR01450 family)
MPASDRYEGFLVDLDGTVWVGEEIVDGAPAALERLRAAGKEVVFVTNESRSSSAEFAERLQAAGIEASPETVLTAGAVTVALAAEAEPGGSAFVIGSPALKAALEDAGLVVSEGEAGAEADLVVVAHHLGFDYAELRIANAALRAGATLFATNREPGLPTPAGVWPGTGSILAAVEYASGATATIGGKPERHLFEQAAALLPGAGAVAMVGDGLGSDVAGAAAAGLGTVLVLTGNSSAEDAASAAVRPDEVLDSIADLA